MFSGDSSNKQRHGVGDTSVVEVKFAQRQARGKVGREDRQQLLQSLLSKRGVSGIEWHCSEESQGLFGGLFFI